ncbi:hypothetical protein RJ641_035972, partial [Dillenia turbinata]
PHNLTYAAKTILEAHSPIQHTECSKMSQREQISHVLIFPLPVQGHVNSMLKLAELLCLSNFHVTFLNSVHNHNRLLRFSDIRTRFGHYPGFQFETFPDGLPEDHPRSGHRALDTIYAIDSVAKPLIKELFKRLVCDTVPPVTCVIADGIFEFFHGFAEELGIPIICFRTISCCSFWVYYCLPKLIETGELPIKGKDLDRKMEQVPGMETILRGRDLPSFFRHCDVSNQDVQLVLRATQASSRAHALILNTFEDLDAPLLSQAQSPIQHTKFSKMSEQEQISHVLIFPIPIQGHVNSMLKLAELLCLSNLHVTFLNSVYNHNRLLQFSDIRTRFDHYPGFRFETIPDGLPEDHPRSGHRAMDIFYAIDSVAKPLIKELFKRLVCCTVPPVTCVIADGIFEFVHEFAEELGIPTICFRTASCCSFWVYYCLPKLIEAGEVPLKGNT